MHPFPLFYVQVNRIIAAFGVRPPIYLVKESDNMAIFLHETTGRSFSTSLTVGTTYDVHGTEPDIASNSPSTNSPFGSYTSFATPHPRPHPPPLYSSSNKKKLIKKSILLSNLSLREQGSSSSSRMQYSVVTQITVSLDPTLGHCCVKVVCDKIKEQVGFEVVLLDSKCYPVMINDITSDPDYWKGTRKVIAARRSNYEKLGGVPSEMDWVKCMEDQDSGDQEDTESPTKKRRCGKSKGKNVSSKGKNVSGGGVTQDELLQRLDRIERRLSLLDDMKKGLECCICKFTCRKPIVVPCCGRIVGCSSCVDQWLVNELRCPLCRVSGQMAHKIHLRGFDEVTSFFRMLESPHSDAEPEQPADVISVNDSEDNDFEELPPFRT